MDFSPENTTPEYLDLPLNEFLELVASSGPAPGGGSVAAVAVALAAGLAGMSARLSTGHLADASRLADRADASRRRVAPLARSDSEAYGRVLEAYREPDSETRMEHLKEALSGASDVPLAVAEAGREVARIAARLVEEGNPNVRGDATAAVFLAEAGVRAATVLVEINLSSANVEDDRLGRANELVNKTAATVRRATEDHRPG
jgi:formiminotetrahydrofolate cyclodeaminase